MHDGKTALFADEHIEAYVINHSHSYFVMLLSIVFRLLVV